MGTVKNLYLRLKAVDVSGVAVGSIRETKESYADLNAEQMSMGQRADGKDITPTYAPITIAIKRATGKGLGAVADRVTLFDTGRFYNAIRTDVTTDKVITTSTDYKMPNLVEKYKDIFGLNQRYKQVYVEDHLRPVWKRKMEDATGLKMGL